jgi:hypothetical protein
LKIIALDRPFLNALPNVSSHLFYVKEDDASRIGLVRRVSSHLRAGGAVLTFPAGQIEPDPDVYPGAVEALERWTDSAGVFIRMVPDTAILPVVVRGVIWEKTARHPLLWIKRTDAEREMLAAALQILAHVAWNKKTVTVQVQIGRAIHARDLGSTSTTVLHQAVLSEMRRLLNSPPLGGGRKIL